jgi:2-polyprenyl-3-methyl-5-hydroxy-6-metoxy-1,4-benzoquinol methylase
MRSTSRPLAPGGEVYAFYDMPSGLSAGWGCGRSTETTEGERAMNSSTTLSPSLEDRVFGAAVGALELFGIYLGDRLGLYEALRGRDGMTESELAAARGIHPRYAREWLEHQAVAGVLSVDDDRRSAEARKYSLPDEHAGVVAEPDNAAHLAPLSSLIVGIAKTLDEVVEAYRTGGGVPFSHYGADLRHGQGAINRPAFTNALVEDWLAAMPASKARLGQGGRAVDVGCGQGWAALALARAFPAAEVWGIDSDAASIEEARAEAAGAGVDVRYECADASALAEHGPFDLILLLEVLHDLARPVEVLAAARTALADDGAILVADEAVAPAFAAPGDELERMMYGWSITHCLPASMAEQPSAAIGTVIREHTVRELAASAGMSNVRVLDVDGGFFRLYELRP